ncbi:MAG: TetR/AcrR family transcriptional regulator C-terminal domain-containing protein [Lachnospiraceae bacterium]|nr:TetR/AcrR family transcriptional regulator C-terminal domain-containing protein [Lachnospiraceae bacterium]
MNTQTTSSISTERTHVLLRQALFTLLSVKPFDKISLTDICRLAMVPRSTFYRHFEDKYALLYHCFEHLQKDAGLELDIRIIQSRERTQDFFVTLFSFLEKNKTGYRKIIASNRQDSVIDCLRNYLEQQICDNLELTFHNQVPNGLPVDMFGKIISSIILAAGLSFIESDISYDIQVLAERLALCTDEGLLSAE